MAAERTGGVLCPVGPVWRRLRTTNPEIELYQPDNSHPSMAGTLASAYSFYSVFFKDDVMNLEITTPVLPEQAVAIRNAVQEVVADSLSAAYRYDKVLRADFIGDSGKTSTDTVHFTNLSRHASGYVWDFGDGTTDTAASVAHIFPSAGEYTVCLTAYNSCDTAKICQTVIIGVSSVDEAHSRQLAGYPNPCSNVCYIPSVASGTPYRIINALGVEQLRQTTSGSTGIVVSHLAPGLYFVMIEQPDGQKQVIPFSKW